MCGIAGLWNHALAAPEAGARVEAMLDAMAHRGPDGRGTLALPGTAAGMVRLALVDLSPRGQQPLWSPDGRVALLFNGEIYNFRQERAGLETRGHRFRTTTDTEVILALYLEHGLDFLERLRGMFALALFDTRERSAERPPKLILARDPHGIKPLYLHETEQGALAFASELKGLLALPELPRHLDREALVDYLSFGAVHPPRTLLEGVRALEAGTVEIHDPQGSGVVRHGRRFQTLPPYAPRRESFGEAAERLRAVLDESVSLHAFADAPVGAFLSGGVDSTGIVALMRPHLPQLHTYTLRFPEFSAASAGGSLDEATEAAATARLFDCRHTTVEVTGSEVAGLLPTFVRDLDQPSTDGLNSWLISRRAAEDVKGVLSGLGGDELFAGYPVTRRMAHLRGTLGGRLLSLAGKVAHGIESLGLEGERLQGLAARRSPLALWLRGHTVFPRAEAMRLVGTDTRRANPQDWTDAWTRRFPQWRRETAIGLSCLLDLDLYMGSQLLRDADAVGMAWSLELRVPFVDREVVAFSRSCRDDYKLAADGGASLRYRDSGAKRVLIEALRDVLPPAVEGRPKRGFALPYRHWLEGTGTLGAPLAPLAAELCHPRTLEARGLLDPAATAAFLGRLDGPSGGRAEDLYPRLWSLMILELWCRHFLDAAPKG